MSTPISTTTLSPAAADACAANGFDALNLPDSLLDAVARIGYETPSPIQAQTIPPLLQGRDVLGHAPTGTGKTAAFSLPLLARIDTARQQPQLMILTPTRELAIQVAEALQRYAAAMPGFRVLPIYGGQEYGGQIRQLRRGVQAVVGTPGRIMDHMRKGTLQLDSLRALVLDEADEMLRMGFIDDVEWILQQTPEQRQLALFSATMPKQIEAIARRYLKQPAKISIRTRTATAETVRQRYWTVSGLHKLDALTRILEVEPFDAVLIFVRTRTATVELAEKLEARGYAAAALNGDIAQKHREIIVERLKRGSVDILVATDVAARGLDVDRVSHVVNFDIPYDTEAYIHRIGRTGRAGRSGEAILFVTPREQRLLRSIEKLTRQKIEVLDLPTSEMVNNKRIADFKQRISDTLAAGELAFMRSLLEQYRQEHDIPSLDIAAALASLYIGDKPLLLKPGKDKPGKDKTEKDKAGKDKAGKEKGRKNKAKRATHSEQLAAAATRPEQKRRPAPSLQPRPAAGMERFRLAVGTEHNARPANIVGAIANEAGLDALYIQNVDIRSDHSYVDLPEGMPKAVFRDLKKAWVCGHKLAISRLDDNRDSATKAAAVRGNGGRKDKKKRKKNGSTASGKNQRPRSSGSQTGKRH